MTEKNMENTNILNENEAKGFSDIEKQTPGNNDKNEANTAVKADQDETPQNQEDINQDAKNNDNTSGNKKGEKKKKKLQKIEEQLQEAELKHAELHDKYLRLYSEFDNFRKRTNKEKLELRNYAAEEVILDVLPVVDDMERALKAIEENEATKDTGEGFRLIYNKLKGILKQKGVEEMETIGLDFDPEKHEAITEIKAPDEKMKGKIIDQAEKGYTMHEKVIRYPKVIVGN